MTKCKSGFLLTVSSIAVLLGSVAAANAQTFTSTDTPIAIPDNNPAGISSSINAILPSVGIITDVNVDVDINHTWVGDLTVSVESPDGTVVRLIDRPGVPPGGVGNSDDLSGTYTFDDAAGQVISENSGLVTIPAGTYQVDQTTGDALADFNGEAPSGTWTLSVTDPELFDIGTLNFWRLILELGVIDQAIVAPAIQAIVSADARQLLGTLEDRKTAAFGGGRQPVADMGNPYAGATWGTWVRLGGSKSDASGEITNLFIPGESSYDSTLGFVQGGISGSFWSNGDSTLIGSVFGHYSDSDATVSDDAGAFRGTIESTGGGVGGSLTWLMASGFYADFVGLFSWHDIDTTTAGGATGSTNGETIAGSAELGYKFAMNDNVNVVPQAQIVYQSTSIDAFVDSAAVTHAFADADNLEGRFGVVLEHVSAMHMADGVFKANGGIHVVHDFDNDSGATVNGAALGFDAKGTELMIAGGIAVVPNSDRFRFGFQGDYRVPLNDNARESFTLAATAGVNF
jgi:outer membrane autotransporter protein